MNFPPQQHDDMPDEEDSGLDAKALEELLEWARMGSSNSLRDKLSPPTGDAPADGGAMGAADDGTGGPPIPGVESEDGGEGGAPDMDKLKLLLAKMKG